ncbi:MAG: hydantoinase B/oxoprolinase family protein [Armatimonadota bacterium]|nr:hydantoinase B/oxoprolinase family protein [Armatimonadota bacterium]MDR7536947.1 hydantoinase B/oxoprolinase family protein [Armatimonadota bacterium]
MSAPFDPITLEIMWSRLINIAEECWVTIWRTAFSTIIGEAQDFGCELFDAEARSIAHSPRSMPVFNLTLPLAVQAMLRHIPPETLREGDVLITNDPWICAGHLFDLAVVLPVFHRGTLVGLVGNIAHCSDIGGTRDPERVRDIYEEGLQIPPLRLYEAGRLNQDLAAVLCANVRRPEGVFGDIQAQVSSCHVGAERLRAFMDEYGLDRLTPLAREVQDRAEAAMRAAIRAVPDGVYRSQVTIDGVEGPQHLPCAVTVAGDEITVDWSGAPPQSPRGGVNCTYTYTAAHTVYALKSILTPAIPSNAGCYRPLHVRAPEGSLLNCRRPAAVNQRTMTGWFCGPAIFRALAPVLPQAVQAFTGLPSYAGAYGHDADGRTFNAHILLGGGQGASAHGDGRSALLYPTSAGTVSVEMFEQRTPLVVLAKELIPDSGGPGAHRGGLGQRLRLRKLHDDGLPVWVDVHPIGARVSQPGLYGGQPGQRARVRIMEGSHVVAEPQWSELVELRAPAQEIVLETSGGSGYGDPARRRPEDLARDLQEGYVTPAGAAAYASLGASAPGGSPAPAGSSAPGGSAAPLGASAPDGSPAPADAGTPCAHADSSRRRNIRAE